MRVEIRNDRVIIDGYVNAVARDSRELFERGERFVEQIVPGAFRRALEGNVVKLLLNHDASRELGGTDTNLRLKEDTIGLRAHAEITDAEVIEKARAKKLRGWSFGFICEEQHMEERANAVPRRYVDKLSLLEVSIIDDRAIPAYEGTLIEARASGESRCYAYTNEEEHEYTDCTVDLSSYRARINNLKKEN